MDKRQKISQKERRKQGFIAKKSEAQVKKILESLKKDEDDRLKKWKWKKEG